MNEQTVIAADGTRLRAVAAGPANAPAAVVLVHGTTMASEFWHHQIGGLSDDLLVVAFDLRGHGRSSAPNRDGMTLETLAADTDAVVRALVPPGLRAVGVGHSLGAIVLMGWAQHTAGRADRCLDGVVLVNATTHRVRQGMAEFLPGALTPTVVFGMWALARIHPRIAPRAVFTLRPLVDRVAFGRHRDPADVALVFNLLATMDSRSRSAVVRMLEHMDARAALAHLDLPTLVIGSAHDRLTPLSRSREIAERVPGAELHVLARSGHCGPMEAPDEVNGLIRRMALDRVAAAA